ncbi:MAG: CotS family spore coat protein [Clostridiaceae bacterium]
MGNSRIVNYIDQVTDKEEGMLLKVLSSYNIKVNKIIKARSAYKIETDNGNLCLKRMKHGGTRIVNGSILVRNLRKKGFVYTADYIKTKDNLIYIEYKNYFFYLTSWIEGEECNMNDTAEAVNCIKLLAGFHIASRNIEGKKFKVKNNLKNWPRIFNSNLDDFNKFEKAIQKKRILNEFDYVYKENIDKYYNQGIKALKCLNSSNYYKLSKDAAVNKTICHNSFYYQNIMKSNNVYYLIDLDSILIDLQIIDIAKFIRRLMFKKEYSWDFNKAKILLEGYSSIKKLSKDDLNIILSMMIFPHKFWKLGRKRYTKRKSWNEIKYMRKLNRIIKSEAKQEAFIEEFLEYIKNYN